ncbi:transcription-associated protein 1-like isoform X2 [Amaranthus tricolor]|uniref:transcription-associated protein 1-like isoform X2 n=1 Tax=Amaranthus tricolor TaxID=29722 RepID=UPI0025899423|nr:transcription-associated protein 1-like isoform X2 [Amaranthus tricolor]
MHSPHKPDYLTNPIPAHHTTAIAACMPEFQPPSAHRCCRYAAALNRSPTSQRTHDRVLVGTGRSCYETLRPLAYSLLAQIVHHVRADLSLPQLLRIIYLFSSNMHDASLTLSIHTTCARLMLNLVEPIYEKGVHQTSMDEAQILLSFVRGRAVGDSQTLNSDRGSKSF